jgi:cytochrome P450
MKQLNQPNGVTTDELHATAGTLIFAGAETTATLLSGCIYYLAANPSIFRILAAEIRTTFNSESEIDMVSVNHLPYMLAVLSETLRIYPPAPASFNRITPPSGCSIAGSYIPGNTVVAVNQWSANHSSLNFTRPYEFLPQRWLGDPEFESDRKKAMQPFSVGPRGCLGKSLAYAEMRLILARFVWNFDVELEEGMEGWAERQRVWMVYDKPELLVKLTPVKG